MNIVTKHFKLGTLLAGALLLSTLISGCSSLSDEQWADIRQMANGTLQGMSQGKTDGQALKDTLDQMNANQKK
jgi:hypothetical protein